MEVYKAMPRIKVTRETETGRNIRFRDTKTNTEMSAEQLVKAIENGRYENLHVRKINGIKTPVSNPDKSKKNNLG